jgi:L-alanine-DL-glutamate epimerase-like enolase superfamily enzyme
MMRSVEVAVERWPIAGRFTIARGSRTEAAVIVVTVREDDATGRGECVPYARYGETIEGVADEIRAAAGAIAGGMPREELRSRMKAGAARNAIDCALVDLEAKLAGTPAHALLGLPQPAPATTCFTISLGTPDEMRAAAERAADRPLLKVKLGGEGDVARIRAVRLGAPGARLVVDANESWTEAGFAAAMRAAADAGVKLVEQPFPAGADEALAGLDRPVPVCADESVHTMDDLPALARLYDAVNIKLDKTGGLTEAILMADAADAAGLKIMIGCMVATSLAMAPAMLLAGRAAFVDLDGPLLLAADREPGLRYDGSLVYPAEPSLWG